MKNLALGVLVTFVLTIPVFGQESNDSIEFNTNVIKFRSATDSALYFLKKAESFASTPLMEARLNMEWAWYHIDRNHMDSAENRLIRGIKAAKSHDSKEYKRVLARNYATLKNVYVRNGDYQGAIDIQLVAINILESDSIDSYTLSVIYKNVAIDYWRMQKYGDAEKWLKIGLDASRKYGYETLELQCYLTLGLVYDGLNMLKEAKDHYHYVFQLIGEDIDKHGRDYMATCNNIGQIYELEGQPDSSIFYFTRALEVIDNKQISPIYIYLIPYYKALVTHNIADHYLKKNDLELALEYSQSAIDIKVAEFGLDHPELIIPYEGIGEVLYKLNEFEKSENFMLKALSIAKAKNINIPKSYNYLGDLNSFKQEGFIAGQYYDSAITSNPSAIMDGIKVYSNPREILYSYYGVSNLINGSESLDAREVEELYIQSKELIRFLYRTSDTHKIDFVTGLLANLYRAFSDLYIDSKEQKWIEYMWEIMEVNKAMKLRIQLRNEYSLTYSLPDSVLTKEKALKDSINSHISEIEPGKFDSTLFTLNKRYNEFITDLESEYPRYHRLKYEIEIRDLASTQAGQSEGQLILNFFEGDDYLYMLKLLKDEVITSKFLKDEFQNLVKAHNEAIFSGQEGTILSVSAEIDSLLKLPLELKEDNSNIVILPDGIVWKLNLAALAWKSGEELNYLGNTTTFSYHYFSNEFQQPSGSKKGVIAFAYNPSPENSDQNSPLSSIVSRDLNESLPGTYDEVTGISTIWPGDFYFSDQANETTFKQAGKDYNIIHLAIHGQMDEIFPENSYLKFSSADSLNDGMLHSYELYNLDLEAELAVLSACYSGEGKLVNGEGLMSLGRSFAYAGVQSLLVSRWQVSDISAPFIIRYFYEGLEQGKSKSKALMYAQNQFLKNDADNITSAPLYWSGFYVIGDDSPMSRPATWTKWLLWMAIIGIMVLTVFQFRKRKLSKSF